jgi:hypothetical protein
MIEVSEIVPVNVTGVPTPAAALATEEPALSMVAAAAERPVAANKSSRAGGESFSIIKIVPPGPRGRTD